MLGVPCPCAPCSLAWLLPTFSDRRSMLRFYLLHPLMTLLVANSTTISPSPYQNSKFGHHVLLEGMNPFPPPMGKSYSVLANIRNRPMAHFWPIRHDKSVEGFEFSSFLKQDTGRESDLFCSDLWMLHEDSMSGAMTTILGP